MSPLLKKIISQTKIFRIVVATLIIFIPLYPKFPLLGVSQTYVAIRLDDIVIALSILVWAVYQLRHHFPLFHQKANFLIFAYFVAIILSTITALLVFQTDSAALLLLNLFRRFEYLSLFFIAANSLYSLSDLSYPYIFLVITTFAVSLYGYGQKYFGLPVVSTMNEEFSKGQVLTLTTWTRINSTFAGHYDLAVFMSVALIIIAGGLFFIRSKLVRIPILITWLMGFQILTFTASRVSVFAFWAGMILALIFIRKYLYIIPISCLVVFSLFNSKDLNQRVVATIQTLNLASLLPQSVQVVPTVALPTATPIVSTKPLAVISTKPGKFVSPTPTPTIYHHGVETSYPPVDVDAGVSRSGEIRFQVEWPRALTAFEKNILVGTGLGSITLATDNDYLRSLGESGLLGFLTFGLIFFWFTLKSYPSIFSRHQNQLDQIICLLFAAMLTMLLNATFIDVFEASKTAYLFWLMMGIYYLVLEFRHAQK